MKKRWIFLAIIVALLAGGWWYARSRTEEPVLETVAVTRSTVENIVSVTGHVEPVERVTTSFVQGGRIARINVAEGDAVQRGDVIAELERDQLLSAVDEAHARVMRETALLDELTAPLTSEEHAVKEARVTQAVQAEVQSNDTLRTTLAHAYSLADDALHEEVDELFGAPRQTTPSFGIRFRYGTTDYIIQGTHDEELSLNEGYVQTDKALTLLKAGLESDEDNVELAQQFEDALAAMDTFLSDLASVVNTYIPSDSSAQTVYESFQTSVASARTAVSTARSEVRSARAAFESAVASREVAEREYAEALAGAKPAARRVQEAAIEVAERSVASTRAAADSAVLYAPLSGRISQIMPEVGETVTTQSPIAELLTVGAYEVVAYIPEADIARVKVGDVAQLTFDAFDRSEVFDAQVIRLALTETVREGVPTYKTTLIIVSDLPQGVSLLPGMTADVDITTDRREQVLSIPRRSVVRDGERTYVRMEGADAAIEERDIVTGLRGSQGDVEVLSGLSEGEHVILYVQ